MLTKKCQICVLKTILEKLETCNGLTSEEGWVIATKPWQLTFLRGFALKPPTAMINSKGNFVTTSTSIEAHTMEVFKDRLKSNIDKDNLKVHYVQREQLCENRLKEAQKNITPPWSMDDLTIVLK